MAFSIKPAEMDGTRWFALFAICVVTLFMVLLNTTGAWQASHNVYYTGVIAGVELLEVACLVLILQSPTLPRKIVGAIVFAFVVYVCVENGKIAVMESFRTVFKDENGQPLHPQALRDKAGILEKAAPTITNEANADRKAVKQEIAELKVFQTKMSAMSPEGIKEAQSEMIPKCGYTGRVDGIRNVLTEAAMRKCGEQITNRLLVLQAMDDAPASEITATNQVAVDLRAKADEIDQRTIWMNIILFAVAGIQAAGLWAFVVWDDFAGTRKKTVSIDPDAFKDLQAQADELARRKANLDDGAERANITKKRKKNRAQSLKILEDQRAEEIKQADARKAEIDAAIAEMQSEPEEEEPPPPPEPDYPVPAVIPEPETPADQPAEEELTDADESEPGTEEPDEDGRRSAA